ncbi:Craniofacial development protein 2 [Stylophora pistillata]|uniref:Craniofacial development protein 2 n=1 Tax=Stylophora pistillata TaxID=50429 RepID=A0A2B4R5T9_STYPI|nr:Craniofacial development protein 2 [Stylophora pistillata]
MHIKLNTDLGPTNLLSVYPPTLTSSTHAKDHFYSQLDDAIKHFPNNKVLILLGDFNARVGNDQGPCPDCLCDFGVGKCNAHGQRLLEVCTYHHLCITNTFFGVKLHHSFSCMCPRSKRRHHLDLIISRREHLNNICTTRAYHSADCDCTNIQLRPKKFHRIRQSATLRINASATAIPENISIFNDILSSKLGDCLELTTEDHWSHIKDTTLAAALKAFGKNDNAATPAVTIKDYILEAVTQFTYLGSTTSNNNCLEVDIGKRIGKAATNMAKLSARVWENKKLTPQTKVAVYRACIVSTLLFGSESWITYPSQEKRLNIFHMRSLRRILSISWTDNVYNNEVLARVNIPSMFTLIRQRRLRWLGHVYRMEDERIPKNLLYGEFESGSRPIGRPKLRFKDVCKRDMLATALPTDK